jgi:Fibronectin type III domain
VGSGPTIPTATRSSGRSTASRGPPSGRPPPRARCSSASRPTRRTLPRAGLQLGRLRAVLERRQRADGGERADPAEKSDGDGATRSRIDLSWTDANPNETRFEIERSSGGRAFKVVAIAPENAVFFTDTRLKAGTTYTYRLRACNQLGCSSPSNETSATTLSRCGPRGPPPPANDSRSSEFFRTGGQYST